MNHQRIAIFLSNREGVIDLAHVCSYIDYLKDIDHKKGRTVEYVIGVADMQLIEQIVDEDFRVVADNVSVREMTFVTETRSDLRAKFRLSFNDSNSYGAMVRPVDKGGYDYLDCDEWIFWGNYNVLSIAPIKPYSIVIPELSYREIPDDPIAPSNLEFGFVFAVNLQNAKNVFVLSERVQRQITQLAGVETEILPFDRFNAEAFERYFSEFKHEYFDFFSADDRLVVWDITTPAPSIIREVKELVRQIYLNADVECKFVVTGHVNSIVSKAFAELREQIPVKNRQKILVYPSQNWLWYKHLVSRADKLLIVEPAGDCLLKLRFVKELSKEVVIRRKLVDLNPDLSSELNCEVVDGIHDLRMYFYNINENKVLLSVK